MVERGVLEGYPDGSFRPEATLTREQGAKIRFNSIFSVRVKQVDRFSLVMIFIIQRNSKSGRGAA
jgi:hypothetical protein